MKLSQCALATLAFLIASIIPALAQTNIQQRSQNKTQLEQGQEWLERDERELTAFRDLAAELGAAGEAGDEAGYGALRERLVSSMQREIDQTRQKTDQAQRELKQSSREVRAEGRDVRRSREAMKDGEDGAVYDRLRDGRQRRDDRGDKADDRNDVESLQGRLQQQQELLTRFLEIDVFGASDRTANLQRQNELAGAFMETLVTDIAATRAELAEDRDESAEDRRERGSDRRTRRRRD